MLVKCAEYATESGKVSVTSPYEHMTFRIALHFLTLVVFLLVLRQILSKHIKYHQWLV